MASVSSGGCARRSNFISAIAGSAVSNSKTRFLIIRRSRSIATAVFEIATSSVRCSRRWSERAWTQVSSRTRGFAVDASVIEADASRYHGKAPGEIDCWCCLYVDDDRVLDVDQVIEPIAELDALVGFCGPRRARVHRRDHLWRLASASSSSRAVRNSATARVWRSGADQSISPGALP